APPIARCSHRAKRRNIRRDSNRYWVKLQGQVKVGKRDGLHAEQCLVIAGATTGL
ncbi:hypothetical protein ABID65_009504, partial [Bradyrhizobium sp. S3.9.2]